MSTENAEFKSSFGKRLKFLRKGRGLSQVEFASQIGVARDTLSRYERGEISPSAEVVASMVGALGQNTTADMLLFGIDVHDDERIEPIDVGDFGTITRLDFQSGGRAELLMDCLEVRKLLVAWRDFEKGADSPNETLLNLLEKLSHAIREEYPSFSIKGSALIGLYSVRLRSEWPQDKGG